MQSVDSKPKPRWGVLESIISIFIATFTTYCMIKEDVFSTPRSIEGVFGYSLSFILGLDGGHRIRYGETFFNNKPYPWQLKQVDADKEKTQIEKIEIEQLKYIVKVAAGHINNIVRLKESMYNELGGAWSELEKTIIVPNYDITTGQNRSFEDYIRSAEI